MDSTLVKRDSIISKLVQPLRNQNKPPNGMFLASVLYVCKVICVTFVNLNKVTCFLAYNCSASGTYVTRVSLSLASISQTARYLDDNVLEGWQSFRLDYFCRSNNALTWSDSSSLLIIKTGTSCRRI